MGTKSSNETLKKTNQGSHENKIVDMESWREVLIHLRTNYPIGLMSQTVDVHFNDAVDLSHVGTLNRIKLMRNELQEVIQYKRDTYEASRSGLAIATAINLRDQHHNHHQNASNNTINKSDHDDNNINSESSKYEAINLYSQNIPAELGIQAIDQTVEEDVSKYDNLSFKSPNNNNNNNNNNNSDNNNNNNKANNNSHNNSNNNKNKNSTNLGILIGGDLDGEFQLRSKQLSNKDQILSNR